MVDKYEIISHVKRGNTEIILISINNSSDYVLQVTITDEVLYNISFKGIMNEINVDDLDSSLILINGIDIDMSEVPIQLSSKLIYFYTKYVIIRIEMGLMEKADELARLILSEVMHINNVDDNFIETIVDDKSDVYITYHDEHTSGKSNRCYYKYGDFFIVENSIFTLHNGLYKVILKEELNSLAILAEISNSEILKCLTMLINYYVDCKVLENNGKWIFTD